MPVTVREIAQWVGGKVDGDETLAINGIGKIDDAQPGNLSFIANPKYAKFISDTNASAVLVEPDFPQSDKTLIRVENPYFAFLTLTKKFHQAEPEVEPGVHPTAVIGTDTQFGENCRIGACAVIGKKCRIGENTIIYPGVVISDNVQIGDNALIYANVSIREGCSIGHNVIIHMGAVIGSDGFGFAFENGQYHKLPQVGIVVIEDDVEIGANTTIDRATLGETIVRKGAKIDNLVQIAHNVQIGEHTAIAAQAGISGSTKVGKYVRMGGQVGIVGHIEIGDQAAIGAQSGIMKAVEPGKTVFGSPGRDQRKTMRIEASLERLPDLLKQVKKLENRIQELEQKLDK